ncbi:MAG: hypothetical protein ACXAEF_11685 [Candidatus Thorarchaeota archaeon]|jgi:hypothetical protein
MCRYGNAYIPKRGKSKPTIPDVPEGLVVSLKEPFQTNFSKLHQDDDGIMLSIHDGHCLCDYKDWRTLFGYLDSIRTMNNLEKVEFLLYWSDDVYPLTNRVVTDMTLDTVKDKPLEGVIYEITVSIPRRLETSIGRQAHLHFKSGKELRGVLSSYDTESGNGTLQPENSEEIVYFHFKEIDLVETTT